MVYNLDWRSLPAWYVSYRELCTDEIECESSTEDEEDEEETEESDDVNIDGILDVLSDRVRRRFVAILIVLG